MITTVIRNLKNNLSRYLTSVKSGREILITTHGKALARIIPETQNKTSIRDRLKLLVLKGLVNLPKTSYKANSSKPRTIKGKPLSEIVIEERR